MTNYKKQLLNCLLDKYERSRSFTGDNKRSQSFSVKVTQRNMTSISVSMKPLRSLNAVNILLCQKRKTELLTALH